MGSYALLAFCQVLPRWFPPCFDASYPGPAAPSLAGKHIADSCSLSTKMMGHLAWDAGHIPCCGRWEPPRFCQERRRRAFAHPRLVLLAAFSRPLSRCYPLSYRLPLLHLYCAEGTSRAQRTIYVLSLLYWLRG